MARRKKKGRKSKVRRVRLKGRRGYKKKSKGGKK